MGTPLDSTVPVQSDTLTQGSGPRTVAYTATINGVPTLTQMQVVVVARPDGALVETTERNPQLDDLLNVLRDIKTLLLGAHGLSALDGERDRATS